MRLGLWLASPTIQRCVMALIVINAIVFGLQTSPVLMDYGGPFLGALDKALLATFVAEIALRVAAHGWRFFRDPWSVFDFSITAVALLPAAGSLSALRALRVLRVLRLVSALPQLRAVVSGLLRAVPGLTSIAGLLCLLLYVSAVIATNLYGSTAPELFGSLPSSLLTLFQVMTLEGWADILRTVMHNHPTAPLFFITFVITTTFTMLNLFIAVIVEGMQVTKGRSAGEDPLDPRPAIGNLRNDIAQLHTALEALRRDLQRFAGSAPKATGERWAGSER